MSDRLYRTMKSELIGFTALLVMVFVLLASVTGAWAAAPVVTSNGGGTTAAIDAAENQSAVTTVTATDADTDPVTFFINGGADAAEFSIDSGSGVLTFANVPDFETPIDTGANNVYDVQVKAMDDDEFDSTYDPNSNNNVFAMDLQSDGKVVIGGQFTTVGGTARNRVARLNSDGSLDTGFNPDANGNINALKVQTDGKIVIGGAFTTVGGTARNYIARLNSDGTLDATFDPDLSALVRTIDIQTDDMILVGGNFVTVGGTARNRIARLNSDGTLDTFDPNSNSSVWSIVVQTDNKILVGGQFTSIVSTSRNRIARLNSDGSLDSSFNPNANNYVYSIDEQADGKILLGGWFTTISATTRNSVARLDSDGTLDSSFNPNADSIVRTIAQQSDGKVLIGGQFLNMSSTARNRIARVNSDGSLDTSFDPDVNNTVWALLELPSLDKIIIGGQFITVSGTSRSKIARLNYDGSSDVQDIAVTVTDIVVEDTTAPVVATGVRFQSQPVSGSNWTLLSDWTEDNPGTPTFSYDLNGAGWSASVDGSAGNSSSKIYAGIDGNDYFVAIRSQHTDIYANGPTLSEDTTTVYVMPLTPSAPTVSVGAPSPSVIDVSINESEPGIGLLYSIFSNTTAQYVQADDTLGATQVWQTLAAWGTPITVTGLSYGTEYEFLVYAGNPTDATPTSGENSASANSATASVITTGPPTSVSITDDGSGGKLNLAWSIPAGSSFNHVHVYRSTESSYASGVLVQDDLTGTSWQDSGMVNGTRYYYSLRSVDDVDYEFNDQIVYTSIPYSGFAPEVPTGLLIDVLYSNGPTLDWDAIEDTADYKLYASTDDATWSLVDTVTHPLDTTTIASLLSNTHYFFTIAASNPYGESAKAASVNGRTALLRGWNVVSMPFDTSGLTATDVYGVPFPDDAYEWISTGETSPDTNGAWNMNPEVVPGFGQYVWSRFDAMVLPETGVANPASITITLLPGWNIISNPTTIDMISISTSWTVDGGTDMTTAIGNAWVGNTLYWWNGDTFDVLTILSDPTVSPWKGYFVMNPDSVNHTLTIQ